MPQERRKKTTVLTHHIGAKVSKTVFDIVDAAATIRAKPRSWVVETGAVLFAQQIAAETEKIFASYRRETRRIRARKGGLARHGK
jgi:hypothetical protein